MLLKKIIKNLPIGIQNIDIEGLSQDSRQIKKNYLFFATKGSKFNGEKYILDAISKGAKAVICGQKCKIKANKIPIIKVKNISAVITQACKIYYFNKPNNITAVTGTNGKSSVADFYHQLLTIQKIPVASIGTLGIKIKSKIKKTNLTTLDIISLHQELSKIKKRGINHVILEASSHGLLQGRLNELKFKTGIFTNFSQDHLDYHKNMKNYLKAKLILFSNLLKKKQNVISDNQIKEFKKLKLISKKKNLNILSIGTNNSTIKINSLKVKNNFQQLSFNYNKKNYKIKIPLIGLFQVKNLLMSLLAAKLSGLDLIKMLKNIKKVKGVNGRLQLVKILPNRSKIFVDYAHTPDALEASLNALKEHYSVKPDIVFGCGGERDKKKRPMMARVCEKNAKEIYITDDNPRNESPELIRQMIISGFTKNERVHNIASRTKAIKAAIINSKPNGVILIAGKGHETTQEYKENILNIMPDLIITHSQNDYHADHRSLSLLVSSSVSHYIPILNCDTLMGINFQPNFYVDISDIFSKKIEAILRHHSQEPQRFADLAILMNSYRAAQCNLPKGFYAEAYSFTPSFPFSDIRGILPPSPKLRPFYIAKHHGFL